MKRFGGIFDILNVKKRIQELEEISGDPDFWADKSRSTKLLREKASLEKTFSDFNSLESEYDDAAVLLELGDEEGDLETISEAKAQFTELVNQVRGMEVRRMLSEEADENNAILEINSGAGGTDASDWAEMLKRMYLCWCNSNGYKAVLLDEQHHEEAGIKSCSIEVRGRYAYGYLKSEIGVHRLVRISPFDSNARRHTAFSSIHVTPDIDDSIEVEIRDVDLRIDTFRASGAGGQHVNTTDSAVRITHLPTGLVVSCQNERSQHKNKARGMKLLKAKIYQHEMQKRQEEIDAMNSEKKKIEWGSQIRSYVLHPYKLVKDLRTGHESSNVDKVLNGELSPFMESWLAMRVNNTNEGVQ